MAELSLGVSVGPVRDYIQRQFAACGVPPQEKAGRLSETIEIMRRLWSETKIDYEGRYFKLHDVGILPHPARPGGIPIWIAADRNETGFKRVARLGDGWVTLAPTLERFTGARARIDGYAKEYGRKGKLGAAALYATFNILSDAKKLETKAGAGWKISSASRAANSATTLQSSPRQTNARTFEELCRRRPDDDYRPHRLRRRAWPSKYAARRNQTAIESIVWRA